MEIKDEQRNDVNSEYIKEHKFQNKVWARVYMISFIMLFIFTILLVYSAIVPEAFEWSVLKIGSDPQADGAPYRISLIGIGLFISAIPMIKWSFGLFLEQERRRKARNKKWKEEEMEERLNGK